MRYDDRIETLSKWPLTQDASARAWSQLMDVIAQGGDTAALTAAIAAARRLRSAVPAERRRAAAMFAVGASGSPALVAFLAEEADLVQPLLAAVTLDDAGWAQVMPRLDERARAIVAARADLPPATTKVLAPPPATQIVDLLARIEAVQNVSPVPQVAPVEAVPTGFALAIDAAGSFETAEGEPLKARLGDHPCGVDGQAIGAWRAQQAIADARLEIAEGLHAGVWRFSASPIVDKAGALLGFRGLARVPRADEIAVPTTPVVVDLGGDDFLHAIDALRDPLAALVDANLPRGDSTEMAQQVAEQGQALVAAIERFEQMAVESHDAPRDLAGLLQRLHASLSPVAESRGMVLDFRIPRDLPAADVDPEALERMVTRLITSVVPLGYKRERIVARLARDRTQRRRVTLTITRPGRLVGHSAGDLRDPQGQDAAMLALGFALRLVEKAAIEVGGSLTIADDRLILSLPARACQSGRGEAIAGPVGL